MSTQDIDNYNENRFKQLGTLIRAEFKNDN